MISNCQDPRALAKPGCPTPQTQSWKTLSAAFCFTLQIAGMANRGQRPPRLHFIQVAAGVPRGKERGPLEGHGEGPMALAYGAREALLEGNPAPQSRLLRAALGDGQEARGPWREEEPLAESCPSPHDPHTG